MTGIHQSRVTARVEDQPEPLHRWLDRRAEHGGQAACLHLLDGDGGIAETLTIGRLAESSRRIAAGLVERGQRGKPVLLAEAPGPGFLESLFGCWRAGAIPVPVFPPHGTRHTQRFEAVARDSGASLVIGSCGMPLIPGLESVSATRLAESPGIDGGFENDQSPCLLQYTSGSTASPKGVMISHANLRAHYRSLSIYRDLEISSVLSWLPPYHDMGLVLKILYAFEAGVPLFWMSPEQFVRRPLRWLSAISRHRAEMSGGPNFAFEACLRSISDDDLAGLDLSCWKAAPCGAERIRPDTLERFAARFASCGFRKEAFLPGYGLAETTLIVTAHSADRVYETIDHPQAGRLISCGKPLEGVELAIRDPETGTPLCDGHVGEIHIKAPVLASGYWQRPDETLEVFGTGLRTGDLGLIDEGRLFVTGRIKDLLIIEGVNLSPEDLEIAAMQASDEIPAAAAFAIDDGLRESAVMVMEARRGSDASALCLKVREAVASKVGIPLGRCLIVRPGIIPRTTSGKIRRSACREAWQHGVMKVEWDDAPKEITCAVEDAVIEAARFVSGNRSIQSDDDWLSLGFGSLDVARLRARIEELTGMRIPISRLMSARSFGEVSAMLTESRPDHTWTGLDVNPRAVTHSQERMWLMHEFDPESTAYHVFGTVELEGPLNVTALNKAFDAVVIRHAMLRSRHGETNGAIHSWIEETGRPELIVRETATDPEAVMRDFARRPFRLAAESPMRALLLRIADDRHLLGICAHHVAMDGWSMRIIAREIALGYRMAAGANLISPGTESADFATHAARHRSWIESGGADSQIAWWTRQLAGHRGTIHLPLDFPRPAKASFEGALESRTLGSLCDRITRLAESRRATPFMVHLAAFLMHLRQHGAGDDLVVAIPVANRHLPGTDGLVGTLVNTLPFRFVLRGGEDFLSLLERVRVETLAMLDNQDAPFERIIDALKPERGSDHSPIAQVMFDHQEIPIAERWPDGVVCRPANIHRGGSQFDFSLLLNVFSDHQQLAVEYRTDLFRRETVASMLDRHLSMLGRICDDPRRSVADLSCLAPDDLGFLDARNQGPVRPEFMEASVPDLIARRIALHPERRAVADAGGHMDYATLGTHSDRVANALRKSGLEPGMRIAVLLERDRFLPAVLLAVWKCGAAYVPLDPSNPKARMELILADQSPIRVLVSESLLGLLPDGTDALVYESLAMDPAPHEPVRNSGTAYLIHTSGSTGKPKGVAVGHRALANFLCSMSETPGFTEADHLLAITTVSFDISLLELFLPLIAGGSVTIARSGEAADAAALASRIVSDDITVMQATPATWRLLLDSGWKGSPTLKILCGGEAMELRMARRLAPLGCELWNLYGPTETTVWSTCWRVPENPTSVRIGRPIANTGIHVLGPDGSPRPPGVTGELWISGAGLAEGYWNDPALTAMRFGTITDHHGRAIMAYSTGDSARWTMDGGLECLGRLDGQVKIRGFRVELGEIEAALAAHPAVTQARVALRGGKTDAARLVAWVTLRNERDSTTINELRQHLASRLPSHMIPADLGVIESFPLGASGKVDVSRLAEPSPYLRPVEETDETTARVLSIWSELLGRGDVHPDDDWFHVGGHSLLALRLFARIHGEFGKQLPLSVIIDHSTPRALGRAIGNTSDMSRA